VNINEWTIKIDPIFESNLRSIQRSLLETICRKVKLLKKDPYIGKNLGPQRPWLWEIYLGSRFRLCYEIWEKKRIIYLKAVYPRNLQKRYLK